MALLLCFFVSLFRVEKALYGAFADDVRIKVLVKSNLIRMAWMMGPDDRGIGPDHRPDGWCMKKACMKKDKDK